MGSVFTLTYVALGDSTAAGIGATRPEWSYVNRIHRRLRTIDPEVSVTNLAAVGATAADVLHQQVDRAIASRPAIVTLSVGPNDLTRGVEPADFEASLRQALAALGAVTGIIIVLSELPDVVATRRHHADLLFWIRERTIQYNAAIHRVAAEADAGLARSNTSGETLADHPEWLCDDGYHPSNAGYAVWADAFWRAIEPRLEAALAIPRPARASKPRRPRTAELVP